MAKGPGRRSRHADTVRVRQAGLADWQHYLQRAQQALQAMQHSAGLSNWAAVAAIAPICAIAAADAVVARIAGVVAKDEDHATAVALLLAHAAELDGVKQAASHLRRIIERKTEVQYGGQRVSEPAAKDLLTHAERLLAWVESVLRSG